MFFRKKVELRLRPVADFFSHEPSRSDCYDRLEYIVSNPLRICLGIHKVKDTIFLVGLEEKPATSSQCCPKKEQNEKMTKFESGSKDHSSPNRSEHQARP